MRRRDGERKGNVSKEERGREGGSRREKVSKKERRKKKGGRERKRERERERIERVSRPCDELLKQAIGGGEGAVGDEETVAELRVGDSFL